MPNRMQLKNARFFRSVLRITSTNRIDESATVACPPSIALAGIERCFAASGHVLDVLVGIDDTRSSESRTEYHVAVEYEPHPNRSLVGRHNDRIELTWRFQHVTLPRFRGRLTIRPSGTDTALDLKGSYEPAPPSLEPTSQVAERARIARVAGRVVLLEFKALLERDFEMVRRLQPPGTH